MATAAPLAWRTPGAKSVQPRLRVDGRWLSSWPTRADAPWQRCDGARRTPLVGLSSCACDVSCVSVRLQAGELADVRGGTATHIDESGPPAAARCTARDGVARLHVQPGCADAAHACSDIYSLYREERGRARRGALRFGGGEQTDETRHERELRLDRMGIRFEEAGFVLTHRATTSSSEIRGSPPPGRRRDSIHACCL